MNIFDNLVNEAIKNQPQLFELRMVVEKEILHHVILRVLSMNNMLKDLTFIGGTCLRYCYGGIRLSEDLDFTGGSTFSRQSLSNMGKILIESIRNKFDLTVKVSTPTKDKLNVDTWKIKIETRPEQKHLPAQRINIDICSIPSYEKQPMMLLNPYSIDLGTSGLIIQAQSREEIYTDKLLAFAFRPNRIKYRDLWDITWLHGQGIKPRLALISNKLRDRNYTKKHFLNSFNTRKNLLTTKPEIATEFKNEMRRFLPAQIVNQTLGQKNFWDFTIFLIGDLYNQIQKS